MKAQNVFLTLLVFFIFFSSAFSQTVQDLGQMTFQAVKNTNVTEPCEITQGKALSYCVENGNRITYIFENNKLNGIMFLTAFLTRSQAEKELIEEVNTFSTKNNMEPVHLNGMVMFYLPSSPLTVSFGIKEYKGTTYLVYYTFLSKDN